MARIAIGGFLHETNCFVPGSTDWSQFAEPADRPGLSRGQEIMDRVVPTSFAIGGFAGAIGKQHELIPTVWTSATAGPYVPPDAYERIAALLLASLAEALPVDGVYLDLHGAMVAEHQEDGEGELLARVRALVGPNVPVVASLDYHCNVTRRMVANADGLFAYRTYPHVDQPETGARAAEALERLLRDGRPKGRALRRLPFLLPLEFQCTMVDPTASVIQASIDASTPDIVACSYLAGFPPSDLYECGPGVTVHAATQEAADRAADHVARTIALAEAHFAEPLLDPATAAARAMETAAGASKPVIIADSQDNPGCGGSGDTVGLLQAMVAANVQDAVFGLLADAHAAEAAHAAGVGAEITLDLGGRTQIPGVVPMPGTFRVEKLCDGRFVATGPLAKGRPANIGPSALLSIGGVKVCVGSRRMQTHDQAVFRHFGIEPADQKIVALKSTCHFRADFQPISSEVLVAIAPGGYVSDPATYPYRRLRPGVRLSPLGPEWSG